LKKSPHIWWYVTLLSSAICFKFFEHFGAPPQLLSSYFEDLVAVPIIFGGALLGAQLLRRQWRGLVLTQTETWVLTGLFALYFELILPVWDARFTQDPWDVVCYGAGNLFFSRVLNKPLT
jgi:membrane-associated PAP2 superfamily phosphatase